MIDVSFNRIILTSLFKSCWKGMMVMGQEQAFQHSSPQALPWSRRAG